MQKHNHNDDENGPLIQSPHLRRYCTCLLHNNKHNSARICTSPEHRKPKKQTHEARRQDVDAEDEDDSDNGDDDGKDNKQVTNEAKKSALEN